MKKDDTIIPMGSAFSQWESLTKDYLEGLVALRRREPGASARMMRLAREMQECEARCGGPVFVATPREMAAAEARLPKAAVRPQRRPANTIKEPTPSFWSSAFDVLLGSVGRQSRNSRSSARR